MTKPLLVAVLMQTLVFLAPVARAGTAADSPLGSLPHKLSPDSMNAIDKLLHDLGASPDWEAIRADLDRRDYTPVVRYTRAVADMQRGAVWDGQTAEKILWALFREADGKPQLESQRLAAKLLFVIGRGQFKLGHNKESVENLSRSVARLRKLGDERNLVRSLFELCKILTRSSKKPGTALPYINELMAVAQRTGMTEYLDQGTMLYDFWRRGIEVVDDYFGRASNRLQIFPPAIDIPRMADLVAFVHGVLLMSQDTDDQMPEGPAVWTRFDGVFNRKLELPSKTLRLRGTLVDQENHLWAATNRGLYRYDGKVFTHFFNPDLADEDGNDLAKERQRTPAKVLSEEVPLRSNIVNEVKQGPDQRLYLATNRGLSIFDLSTSAWEHITSKDAPIPELIERVAPAPDGSLVLAWRNAYAIRGLDGHWQVRDFVFPSVSGKSRDELFGLLVDEDGKVWVHGLGGAHQLTGTEISRTIDRRTNAVTNNVNHILRADDGALWVATADGICRQDGASCEVINAKRGMPAEWALDLLEWPADNIWASVYLGGLNRFAPPHYQQYSTRDGFPQPNIYSIAEFGAHLYFCHPRGLTRLDPKTGRLDNFISGAEGLTKTALVSALPVSTKQLVLLGEDSETRSRSLILFDGKQGKILGPEHGLPQEKLFTFCEVEPGKLLIAYRSGVWKLDTLALKAVRDPAFEKLAAERIVQVQCKPEGSLFAFTEDKQIYQRVDGQLTQVDPKVIGLQGEAVNFIQSYAPGEFLLGERGIYRYLDQAWHTVPLDPEHFNFRVEAIDADEQGRLYFATESGVFVFNGEDWTRLGVADGLISDNTFSVMRYQDHMWFAGNGGVVKWNWPKQDPPETFLLAQNHAYLNNAADQSCRLRQSSGVEKKGWIQLHGLAGNFEMSEKSAPAFLPPSAQDFSRFPCEPQDVNKSPDTFQTPEITLLAKAAVPYRDDRPKDFFYHFRLNGGAWQRAADGVIKLSDLSDGPQLLELRATDRRLQQDATPTRYRFVVDTPLSPAYLAGFGFLGLLLLYSSRQQLLWLWLRWHHRHFREISPSPFSPNRPALRSNFYGRAKHLKKLRKTTQSIGGVTVLWGPRGMGKHSLLKKLAQDARSETTHAVEIDLAAATAGGDVAQLVKSIVQSLVDVLVDADIDIDFTRTLTDDSMLSKESTTGSITSSLVASLVDSSTSSGEQNPFDFLSRVLRRLEVGLPDDRVLLLLDNAEVLSMAVESDAGYGSYLFPFLRSLAQQRTRVTVVLAMEGRWFELSKRFEQLFSFATPLAVGRFHEATSHKLLSDAFRDRALVGDKEMKTLLRLAGGHPFLLQLIGHRLVSELNRRQTNLCTQDLLHEATETLLADPQTGFSQTWTELEREERLVVVGLAEMEKGHIGYTLENMLEKLNAAGGKLLFEEVRRAMLALEKENMVEQLEQSLRLRGDLFLQWVGRHHTIASVLEESHEYVGHYQLMQKLGSGGMGMVYKARDLVRGDTVALKLLRPELSENKRSRRRFLREARLGKSLRHANIVQILDYGEQTGRLYLAMEYIEGMTLWRWARTRRYTDPLQAVEITAHLASALAAIHELSIVHRDVKSDNIMVVGASDDSNDDSLDHPPRKFSPGSIKLMDFGLAKGKDVSKMTRAGSVLGTMAYMSPEQAKGSPVDARSDLYSLGVVLYELLAGQTPFAGTEAAVLHAIIYEDIPPLSDRVENLPSELTQLVEKLLSKQPEDRPQRAKEVENNLIEVADILGSIDVRQRLAASSSKHDASSRSSGRHKTPPPPLPGMASRTLELIRADSLLLGSLEIGGQSSVSSMTDSIPDIARVMLYRISAAVARGSVEEGVLQDCLTQVIQGLDADRGLLVLVTEDQKQICVAACGREEPNLDSLPILSSLVKQSVNMRMGSLYAAEADGLEDEMGTAACVPMWAGETVLGALAIDRKGEDADPFDDVNLELLVSIGYLLGLGLERDRLTQQVLNKQRMAAMGQMLAGVAHDIRGPMAVISGYAELIPIESDGPTRERSCTIILRQVDEMSHMIGNLIAFARGDSQIHPSDVNLADLAEDVREALRLQCSHLDIKLNIESEGETARVDLARTKRIVFNLSKNAIDAMGEKGKLQVQLTGKDGSLDVLVSDSGPGIPKKIQDKMFEPFVTTGKKGGTGLGLSIVKRFVDDHKGTISVDSDAGVGARFTIHLPSA